jgi:hypothetical protein
MYELTLRMASTAAPRLRPLANWMTARSMSPGSTCDQEERKSEVDETVRRTLMGTLGCMLSKLASLVRLDGEQRLRQDV